MSFGSLCGCPFEIKLVLSDFLHEVKGRQSQKTDRTRFSGKTEILVLQDKSDSKWAKK